LIPNLKALALKCHLVNGFQLPDISKLKLVEGWDQIVVAKMKLNQV
jgi:hypothetical protein